MYRRNKQDQVIGVLNDFDLSIFFQGNSELSEERTGTVPFVADFLLTGQVRTHIYGLSLVSVVTVVRSRFRSLLEFDVESFIYVLLWITRRYGKQGDKFQTIKAAPFQEWLVAKADDYVSARHRSLVRYGKATPEHQSHNIVVKKLCQFLSLYRTKQNFRWELHQFAEDLNEAVTCPPPATTHDSEREKETFDACMKIVKEHSPQEYVNTLFNAGRVEQNSTLWEELERRGKEGRFWKAKVESLDHPEK
jgi:hypothetical protein